jgi:hypothetical protein
VSAQHSAVRPVPLQHITSPLSLSPLTIVTTFAVNCSISSTATVALCKCCVALCCCCGFAE